MQGLPLRLCRQASPPSRYQSGRCISWMSLTDGQAWLASQGVHSCLVSLCNLQAEYDLGAKWLDVNTEKYKAEVNKYKNLKRSLSKRSEKQAEIRDNTAMMLNSGFHTYAYVSAHTVSWEVLVLSCILYCKS